MIRRKYVQDTSFCDKNVMTKSLFSNFKRVYVSREILYSSVPNKGGTTAIYFELKIGQKWPKSCIFI